MFVNGLWSISFNTGIACCCGQYISCIYSGSHPTGRSTNQKVCNRLGFVFFVLVPRRNEAKSTWLFEYEITKITEITKRNYKKLEIKKKVI